MNDVRPVERDDLPAISRLYERVARSGSDHPPAALTASFERALFDQPWADPAIPSLVRTDRRGEIVAFLGSHVRRMRINGRSVRMACSGHLVASPDERATGTGAMLLRRYLSGPQDLTITDGATETVRLMWTALGGHLQVHASMSWTKALRPAAAGAAWLTARNTRPAVARSLRLVAPGVDAAASALLRRVRLPAADVSIIAEPLTPETLVEQIRTAGRRMRLHPDYDLPFLRWLFAELDLIDVRGTPVRFLVRDGHGRAVGWYVYYLVPGGVAQVLAAVASVGDVGPVLDHLFRHAAAGGAVAVRGRVEPAMLAALRERRCLFGSTEWALVHSADPAVLSVLPTPRALLTRLDGEWWMAQHLQWRDARTHPAPPDARADAPG